MQDFRELEVWKKAHELALDVYRCTEALPKNEVFGLTAQLRRAAVAVPTRIAEGCGQESGVEMELRLQRPRAVCFGDGVSAAAVPGSPVSSECVA